MNEAPNKIRLLVGSSHTQVLYQPPTLGDLLVGLELEEALAMIPRLLPICARAQQIAAERASEAARGIPESDALRRQRDEEQRMEQGLAAAWRLLVDWPRFLEQAPDLSTLKQLRAAPRDALARGLRSLVPAAHIQTGLDDWIEEIKHGDCTASAVLHHFPELAPDVSLELTRPAALVAAAGERLENRNTASCGYVGALAMARHPLVEALQTRSDIRTDVALLLAMLLDTLAIAEALADPEADNNNPAPSLDAEASQRGLGWAITARGPLFHRAELDAENRVVDWQSLAPTDWHFASGGVVEALIRQRDASALNGVMLAVDPCAAWDVVDATPEAA
ncbi:MAG: hypothetical protein Cons2KO_12290 [Congregibacter sp.]